jgi:hypothetical protein
MGLHKATVLGPPPVRALQRRVPPPPPLSPPLPCGCARWVCICRRLPPLGPSQCTASTWQWMVRVPVLCLTPRWASLRAWSCTAPHPCPTSLSAFSGGGLLSAHTPIEELCRAFVCAISPEFPPGAPPSSSSTPATTFTDGVPDFPPTPLCVWACARAGQCTKTCPTRAAPRPPSPSSSWCSVQRRQAGTTMSCGSTKVPKRGKRTRRLFEEESIHTHTRTRTRAACTFGGGEVVRAVCGAACVRVRVLNRACGVPRHDPRPPSQTCKRWGWCQTLPS